MKARVQISRICLLFPVAILLMICSLACSNGLWDNLGHRYEQSLTLQVQSQEGNDLAHPTFDLTPTIHWDETIPVEFGQKFIKTGSLSWSENSSDATLIVSNKPSDFAGRHVLEEYKIVFALVAPFPTVADEVSFQELISFWSGAQAKDFSRLLVREIDIDYLVSLLGEPDANQLQIIPSLQELPEWQDANTWAILPFNQLTSPWKVIRIDGSSPLSKAFNDDGYPLTVKYYLSGRAGTDQWWKTVRSSIELQSSNRDPERLTQIIMTGVTALVRATADRMETKGLFYPAEDIGAILRGADITHVSNEVAFNLDCPLPEANSISLRFCSRPRYIELLDNVGADVIELTGNHINDWQGMGRDVTFELYREHGMMYYGGGRNLEESYQPALFNENGNKVAFIGCNDPGPDFNWATATSRGAAPCGDYEWMIDKIAELKQADYQVIATIQYHENYTYLASPQEREIYRSLADAGATIIQGSQAHTPKEMEFYRNAFIHYGLGNLFFDQMHYTEDGKIIEATRQEFIDRYTFYDNQLISIELITTMLEDYARPRLMNMDERSALLNEIFAASKWTTGD